MTVQTTSSKQIKVADTKQLYFKTATEINSGNVDFMRAHELKLRLLLIGKSDPVMEPACVRLRAQLDKMPHKRYIPEKEGSRDGSIAIEEDVIPV